MTQLPQVVPDPTLPERVTIYEVGPRDGLQNEAAVVPTASAPEYDLLLFCTPLTKKRRVVPS